MRPCGFHNVTDAFHLQVLYASALCTDKMVMGGGIGIEMVHAVP